MNKNICKGIQNEKLMLPIIREYFCDPTIEKTTFIRCPFDYEGSGVLYELKTRTCCYNRYPDTIFPCSKFNYQPEKQKYLIFSFTDGNYQIKYDPVLFETFKKDTKQYRFDRGTLDKPAEYINIPIDKLTKMNA
jgi:hypothetical protein